MLWNNTLPSGMGIADWNSQLWCHRRSEPNILLAEPLSDFFGIALAPIYVDHHFQLFRAWLMRPLIWFLSAVDQARLGTELWHSIHCRRQDDRQLGIDSSKHLPAWIRNIDYCTVLRSRST